MKWQFFLLIPLFLYGEKTHFSSDTVSYKDDILQLDGNVTLENNLGILKSQHANITRKSSTFSLDFLFATLQDSVLLELPYEAYISCDKAEIDFSNRHVDLTSIANQVEYHDIQNNIVFSSPKLHCDWLDDDYKDTLISTDDHVQITYLDNLVLDADSAQFHTKTGITPESIPKGIIKAEKKSNGSPCILYRDNDQIACESILINTLDETLSLKNPMGKFLTSVINPHLLGETIFSADALLWDHKKNILTLNSNASIEESSFGKLTSSETIIISQILKNNTFDIETVTTEGSSLFEKEGELSIQCDGTMHFDRTTGELIALQKEQPILFKRLNMTVFSQKALLHYTDNKPSSITFNGDVKIQNDSIIGQAEIINYLLAEKQIELIAKEGEKVIFQNIAKTMQISADKLLISKDPVSDKEVVKGIGRVHFSFDDNDKNELLKLLGI